MTAYMLTSEGRMERRAPPQLRLPGLAPRDLGVGNVGTEDAESPVDVRALSVGAATPSPAAGTSRKLQLPPLAGGLTQNEIKKAQNRKSAKRFREAQKRRWQQLNEELERQKALVSELRAALVSGAATPNGASLDTRISIGSLTSPDQAALSEAEAALYAQLLCSAAPPIELSDTKVASNTEAKVDSQMPGPPIRPYVAELGRLHRCVVAGRDGCVRATRRGAPLSTDAHLVRDVSPLDAASVRNALACADAVAVGYVREGTRYNAVLKPVPNTNDVLLAEFVPFSHE